MKTINTLILGLFLSLSLTAQEWVIEPQYLMAGDFEDGLALVAIGEDFQNAEIGFINESGEIVLNIPDGYTTYKSHFSEGLLSIVDKNTNQVSFMDKEGNIVISTEYYDPGSGGMAMPNVGFTEDLAPVARINDAGTALETAYIDKSGNIAIDWMDYPRIGNFSEGLAPVQIESSAILLGFIDKEGNVVIEPKYAPLAYFTQFQGIGMFKDGQALVAYTDSPRNSETGAQEFIIIDKTGNEISKIDKEMDASSSRQGSGKGLVYKRDDESGKYGYIYVE